MANDSSVVVRIVGDASAVRPAIEETKGSLNSLDGVIAGIGSWVDKLITQFAEAGSAGKAAGGGIASGMVEAKVATEAEGNALTRMVMKVHEGAEAVRTFQARARAFAEVYVGLFAIESITHWAESLGEAAEKTAKLAAQTGMTTGQVQGLNAAATLSGTSIDALAKGMAMLDNRAVTASGHASTTAKALGAMGISAKDGTTNMQRLLTVADKFHGMADGPEKMALAMQLFGRSGKDMIPFLNQGSAAIQDLIDKSKEYGAVNDKAQEQGERIAESVNLARIAWEGLKQTLTEAFGPLLTQLVDGFSNLVKEMHDSYESGGAVKVIFDAITEVVQALGEMVNAVALGFSSFFSTTKNQGVDWGAVIKAVIDGIVVAFKTVVAMIVFVADGFVAAFHLMKGAAEAFLLGFVEVTGGIRIAGTALGEFMQIVGKVCWDALHLEWGSIAADWENGMEHVRQTVAAKANQIVQETNRMKNAVKTDFADMMNTGKDFNSFYDQLMNGSTGGPKHEAPKVHFGGGTGDAPDITSPGKSAKGKKPKDEIVPHLEEELEAKITAWNKEQVAQGTAQEYSLQSIADFWSKALEKTNLSAKDRLEIQKKFNAAEAAVQKDAFDRKLEGYKHDLAEADKNADAKLAIMRREAAATEAYYGADSKQARAAREAVYQAEKAAAEQRLQLTQNTLKAISAMESNAIEEKEKDAQQEEALGKISKAKLLELERQFENELYQIDLAALQKSKKAIDPMHDPVAYAAICTQIEQLERQHQNKLNAIDRAAETERSKLARTAISSVSQNWGDNIGKMLTMQESFSAGVKSMWQGVQQAIGSAISQIIQQWLEEQLTALILGKSQTQATNASSVASYAGVAGAAGVASFAGAPWPIDMGAPAFGASMASTAMGFMGLASFDVGAWNLSKDQMAMVHSGEMIIPANLAGGMRDLFKHAGNDNSQTAAPAQQGGEQHFHYAPTLNGAHPTWDSMMNRSERDARRWFKRQAANGAKV